MIPSNRLPVLRSGFHYRKAVAPLKRECQGIQVLAQDRFHYRKAVAPLKRAGLLGADPQGRRFHYRKAVAPLKPDLASYAETAVAWFPLPKGGGPIEATSLPTPTA